MLPRFRCVCAGSSKTLIFGTMLSLALMLLKSLALALTLLKSTDIFHWNGGRYGAEFMRIGTL
jgi:hypothetical protein